MAVLSRDFEDNLIRALIGVVVIVIGASLVSTSVTLFLASAASPAFVFPGIVVLFVGLVLIFYALQILVAILKSLGIDLQKKG